MTNDSKTQNAEALSDADIETALGGGLFSPSSELSKRGFNPQPEPPARLLTDGIDPASEVRAKGFNPQPEPPALHGKTFRGV